MYIADTLSRAYLRETASCEEVSWACRSHQDLRVSPYRLALIEKEYLQDPVCESLSQVILNEWLDNICDCDPAVLPFFLVRRELIIQGQLFLLGSCLFFPNALRKEITSLAHSSRIGLGGCLRRLQECMFRPRMNSQMKDFVGQCDVGLTHRDSQVREPILQRDVSQRPWAKVVAELCHFPGRVLLVVSDYFSIFIEVKSRPQKTPKLWLEV